MTIKRDFQILIVFAIIFLLFSPVLAHSTATDLLIYFNRELEPPSMAAYNPATGEILQLPIWTELEHISTSSDGRIAYIQDNDVWVLDLLNAPNSPTNITQTPDEQELWLNWTPDGSLLQYKVRASNGLDFLYVYDGSEVYALDYGYNVERHWNEHGWYAATSHNENSDGISWSVWNNQELVNLALPPLRAEAVWHTLQWTPNNHLFITIGYSEQDYMQPIGPTDIFYWNGTVVSKVDNPSEDETFMLGEWSADGRLTLYTTENFQHWYIWDGVSFTSDGIPNTAILTAINRSEEIIQDIDWMPDGSLAVVIEANPESDSLLGHPFACSAPCLPQVYLWSPQSLRQVTSYSNSLGYVYLDVHDNGSMAVSISNGLVTSGGTIFDKNLEAVLQWGGPYAVSRWSADGNFAFCNGNALFVWDGQETTRLSSSTYSKWLMSQSYGMVCSTG